MPPRYKETNILIFNVFIFILELPALSISKALRIDWNTQFTLFFMDTDSKISSFLACDLDLCTIILVLHDKGVKRLFYERVSSLSYKPQASPKFPGMSRFVWDSLHFARLWTWAGTCTRYSAGHCRWAGLAQETELSLGLGYLWHITVC